MVHIPRTALALLALAVVLATGGCATRAPSPVGAQARVGTATAAASPDGGGSTPTAAAAASTASAGTAAGTGTAPLHIVRKLTPVLRRQSAATAPIRLTAVQFVSAADGWAVGRRCASGRACQGVVIATRDGGATWSSPHILPAPLSGVQFLDARTGWVFGGGLFRTSDGGATWTAVPLPAAGRLVSAVQASFADAEHGWLLVHRFNCATEGCPLAIYQTSDGGSNWHEVAADALPGQPGTATQLPWAEYPAGGDLGGGRGWLLAQTPIGLVQTTTDGGRRWRSQRISGDGGPVGADLTATGVGWAAGDGGTAPGGSVTVWQSGDFGASWHAIAHLPGHVVSLAAAADGASAWLLTRKDDPAGCPAQGCAELVSVLGPHAVAAGPLPAGGFQLTSVSPLDARTAWAVATGGGPGDAIVVTHDGGRSWHAVYRTTSSPSPAARWGFWDRLHGWAVGSLANPGAILMTRDGGATWSQVGRAPAASIYRAGFTDATHGWVVTGQDQLETTTNGGATWLQRPVAATARGYIEAAGFTTPRDGWLLPGAAKSAPAPRLLLTHDGGASWSAVRRAGGWFALAFASPTRGWGIARAGSGVDLFTTGDGGASWRPVAVLGPERWTPSAPAPLWVGAQLAAAGPDDVWLASGTHLLHSGDGGQTWTEASGPSPTRLAAAPGGLAWVQVGDAIYRVGAGDATWTQVAWVAGN